jgi:hypothetical protein
MPKDLAEPTEGIKTWAVWGSLLAWTKIRGESTVGWFTVTEKYRWLTKNKRLKA